MKPEQSTCQVKGFQLIELENEHGSISGYRTNLRTESNAKNYLASHNKEPLFYELGLKYETVAVLHGFYVEDEERGLGVGSDLLDDFLNEAEYLNVEAVILICDTLESNEFSLFKWYERNGFVIYPNEDPNNCPLMVKE